MAPFFRFFLLPLLVCLSCGCSYYQPTKDVWKTTKGLWNEYVSPPAHVDYDDKGDLAPEAAALSKAMMGMDVELGRLERVMQNADKPPTQEWLDNLFASFPWLDGFAGVKADGTILGQQPADSLKELDFNPLLYEDKRQSSRALRADVQPSPLGPEIMLAAPLYDGIDFLGVVIAYFDMRSLMKYSADPDNIVALCPTALLWPGKFDFGATPLAGVDWAKVVAESSAGTCSNAHGKFFYQVRYLANLPIIFATPEKGDFPTGDGKLEQAAAYFPQTREKLPPPPVQERKRGSEMSGFARQENPEPEPEPEQALVQEQAPEQARAGTARRDQNEIQQGSRESMLLRKGAARQARRRVQEHDLEGENIRIEPIQRARRAERPSGPPLDLIDMPEGPTLPGGRPSPFGPKEDAKSAGSTGEGSPGDEPAIQSAPPARELPGGRPSPFGPPPEPAAEDGPQAEDLADGEKAAPETPPAETGSLPKAPESGAAAPAGQAPAGKDEAAEEEKSGEGAKPALLPGGRPSPFGPRN